MFTWICPKCGREVPPAYNECPDCNPQTSAGGISPPQQSLEPQPASGPAQPASPMFQPAQPVPPQYPPRRAGTQVPTWLLAIMFAILFVGLGGGLFWFLNRQHQETTPIATVESPAAKPGAAQNAVQKYIEVTGVRFGPAARGVSVTFVVINHSDSDIVNLSGNATLWGRTQKSEEDAVGTFTFQLSMAAKTSKELTMPFTTKLKLKTMPDWQNVTTDVQITAPTTLPTGS